MLCLCLLLWSLVMCIVAMVTFRINTPRKQGGLGAMKIPLLADKNCDIAQRYGVYKDDDGIAFRSVLRLVTNFTCYMLNKIRNMVKSKA